jgi:hypothetical protein
VLLWDSACRVRRLRSTQMPFGLLIQDAMEQ